MEHVIFATAVVLFLGLLVIAGGLAKTAADDGSEPDLDEGWEL